MYVLLAFACLLFTLLFLVYERRRRFLDKIKNLRGPPKWWLLGHIPIFADRSIGFAYGPVYRRLYGKTIKFFVGHVPIVGTTDSKLIEKVLGSPTSSVKADEYKFFKRWWGDGLLVSSGEKWKSHRKILTPAFHYNILEDFVEVFESKGKQLIENLSKEIGKETFNISDIFSGYTFDVICATAMGTTVNAQGNPDNVYFKSVREMCELGIERMLNLPLRLELLYRCSSMYRRELKIVGVIKDFSMSIIRKRRGILKESNYDIHQTDEFGKRRKATFMDILLCSKINGENLIDEEVREEVDTFLFEGFDTTSIALSFIAFNLALNPEVQKKVYEEIKDVFYDDFERPATIEDLQKLKYMEMVIKESLRICPSVPFLGRLLLEDIQHENFTLPKGLTLMINNYLLNREESVFPEPEKFIPERFDINNEANKNRDPYAYVPFSAGSRNCIGQKFAMLELKSATSKLLKNFEVVKAVPEFTPKFLSISVTLYSTNGVHVGLRKRQK